MTMETLGYQPQKWTFASRIAHKEERGGWKEEKWKGNEKHRRKLRLHLHTLHSYNVEGNKWTNHVSPSPRRNASNARTSVTYCRASKVGIRCSRPLSVGSLIQPSIGTALSKRVLVVRRVTWNKATADAYPHGKCSSWDYYPRSWPYSDQVRQS